jgi:hypothetical protein
MRTAMLVAVALPLALAAAPPTPLRIDIKPPAPSAVRSTTAAPPAHRTTVSAPSAAALPPASATAAVASASDVPRRLDLVANEYGFTGPSTVAAGRRFVSIRNEGNKLHHVQLLRLTDDKQIGDVFTALRGEPSITRLPGWATPVGGPNGALPGATIESLVPLTVGRYAVICWIRTEDGTPHFMRGMMMPFDVVDAGKDPAPPTGPLTTVIVREYGFQFIAPTTPGRRTIRVENVGSQPHELLIVRLNPGTGVEEAVAWSEGGQPGPAPVADWTGVASLAPG